MAGSPVTSNRCDRRGCKLARLFALALLAAPLGGCESLGSLAFWKANDEPALEEPADKLYNEGLFLLNDKKDIRAATKRFDEHTTAQIDVDYGNWFGESDVEVRGIWFSAGRGRIPLQDVPRTVR